MKMAMSDAKVDRLKTKYRGKVLAALIGVAILIVILGTLWPDPVEGVEVVGAVGQVEEVGQIEPVNEGTCPTIPATAQPPIINPVPVEPAPPPQPGPDQVAIEAVPHPGREPDALVTVKVSRYDPMLGGTNCFSFVNGVCVSRTASGRDWEDGYGWLAACAPEWPFGTIFEIGSRRWECWDRGGKIKQVRPNVFWVDMLSHQAEWAYGSETIASVWYPTE